MIRKLTHKLLLTALEYDEATGIFYWRYQPNGWIKPGDRAGKDNKSGYRQIKVFQKWYYEHRLAWFYKTKRWPSRFIDHVNGCKADNRWVNLRECSTAQNGWNSKKRTTNRTGYKWVTKRQNRFYVAIRAGGKQHVFGSFDSAREAYKVAVAFAKARHREFFRGQ